MTNEDREREEIRRNTLSKTSINTQKYPIKDPKQKHPKQKQSLLRERGWMGYNGGNPAMVSAVLRLMVMTRAMRSMMYRCWSAL